MNMKSIPPAVVMNTNMSITRNTPAATSTNTSITRNTPAAISTNTVIPMRVIRAAAVVDAVSTKTAKATI